MSKRLRLETEETVERIVDIYDSLDNFSGFEPGFGIQQEETLSSGTKEATRQTPGKTTVQQWPVSVTKSPSRAAAVCLGLLCVLLLAGIIVLAVIFIEDKSMRNEETDRLRTKLYNVTEDKILSEERNALQKVLNNLGWIRFGSSYYNISAKQKGWWESREDCLSRGADLVIINSREEQEFVDTLWRDKRVWIGLTDRDMEGAWRWVDGTPLTIQYWRSQQPDNNGPRSEDCAESTSNGWNDFVCSHKNNWVCEIAF